MRSPEAIDDLVVRFGRDNVVVELSGHGKPGDDETNDLLASIARERGLPVVATGNVHHATPDEAPARRGHGRDPRPAQHRRARRLAGPLGVRTPAQRCGDGAALRPLSGCDQLHRHPRQRARLRPAQGVAAAPEAGHPRGRDAGLLAADPDRARLPGALRRHAARAGSAGARRRRARGDPPQGLRRLLRHRPRHRRVREEQGHPVPGEGVCCQLRGLLRARDHRDRLGLLPAAVRAVHLRAPRGGARHRCRLRLRPPRGGHPVGLRHLRAAQRRAGLQRGELPAADGGPRRRQGARLLAPGSRTPGRSRSTAGRARSRQSRRSLGRSCLSPRSSCPRPATSASTPAAWCSPSVRSARSARSSAPGCRAGPSCSGTRTAASRWDWSSSTCWAWGCWVPSTT